MNIKDFEKVSVIIPMHYKDSENSSTMTSSLVEVTREGDINIKIRGFKHSEAFIALILSQQVTGFQMMQQPAVPHGIPGHNVEVQVDPKSPSITAGDPPNACENHTPIQHRDAYEAWCEYCGFNRNYEIPRKIAFSTRPARIGDSLRRFEDAEKFRADCEDARRAFIGEPDPEEQADEKP